MNDEICDGIEVVSLIVVVDVADDAAAAGSADDVDDDNLNVISYVHFGAHVFVVVVAIEVVDTLMDLFSNNLRSLCVWNILRDVLV